MKIAILSDIHANLPALEVVLSDISRSKCDHIFILGDLVGYYHWPREVVEKVMGLQNCTVIRGNHEDLLMKFVKDESFASQCRLKYGSSLDICVSTLSHEQMRWLDELPLYQKVTFDDIGFALFHGSERELDEYLYPEVSQDRLNDMVSNDIDYIFFGHTHYPVVFTRGRAVIANPGSVGQPRDVGTLASYLILNTKNGALIPRRLPFDSEAVRKKSIEFDPSYSYLIDILKRNNPYV